MNKMGYESIVDGLRNERNQCSLDYCITCGVYKIYVLGKDVLYWEFAYIDQASRHLSYIYSFTERLGF